ncbi:uroporphyrinogen-III synthase [Flavitalea sp. BT771]|uniref:uroporphyrinogen-III synthase n=1 Tax=Flavitalea sp. BT771 TaxID=3063329 RepID=UPI0026E147F4|nr:uroporphyrinogen-III synthase [Flavitalea sp. BT771]MDO6433803.1 uroporphyrinogen-III synthase [Flavitalea sp. BT771]MDV6222292.1 uroporphyrinogen-III synthase [Flavitalea sp. BT771]
MSEPAHILSTRPLDTGLLAHAKACGIVIDTQSFISTAPVKEEGLQRRVRELSHQPLTAVFTSVNAVEAVAAMVGSKVPWEIFCIGAASRQSVHEHFGADAIAGKAPSAAELADVVLRRSLSGAAPADEAPGHHPAEVFFFCGDQRRDELPDKLSAAGVHVNELVVYRTTQTPHYVERPYDGIAFFSPSAVHSFFSVNIAGGETPLFAIGSTTAQAIRGYCTNPVIISGSPVKEALVQQIIEHFQTNI